MRSLSQEKVPKEMGAAAGSFHIDGGAGGQASSARIASRWGWAALLVSSVPPVAAVAVLIAVPIVDDLAMLVVFGLAGAGLLLISLAELIFGLIARRRWMCLDAALRATLLIALASPLGPPVVHRLAIAWSFAQTFDPAYACDASSCADAVVDTSRFGGEMLTSRCYIELVRLGKPAGGREAAVATLRREWPWYGPADDDRYADAVELLSLGRGFYRAVRCEDD